LIYKLTFDDKVIKDFKKIERTWQKKILKAIQKKLIETPYAYPIYSEMQFFESVWSHNTALPLLRIASYSLQTAPCLVTPVRTKIPAFPSRLGIGKKLVGDLSPYYRLRVGDYRVVYSIEDDKLVVTIIKIRHRKSVYR